MLARCGKQLVATWLALYRTSITAPIPTKFPTMTCGIYDGSIAWEKWVKLLWLEIEAKGLVS